MLRLCKANDIGKYESACYESECPVNKKYLIYALFGSIVHQDAGYMLSTDGYMQQRIDSVPLNSMLVGIGPSWLRFPIMLFLGGYIRSHY